MDADPRYLPAFIAVCEHGTVSAAAEALHRTQPAVTYQIRQLEAQLGAALFERVGRRIVLTPAGRVLRDFAARMMGELREISSAIAQRQPSRKERLRIASVSGFGRYVLFPRLLGALDAKTFGDLRVELSFPTAEEAYARVEDGSCDVGVVYLPRVSSRLLLEPIFREELVLITPRSLHRTLGVRPAALSALATYGEIAFVTYEESDYVFGKWFHAVFRRPPRAVSSTHHVEELEEVVQFVRGGHGVSIVPLDCAAQAARQRHIEIVRPREMRCYNDVFAVTRPRAARAADVAAVLSLFRSGDK